MKPHSLPINLSALRWQSRRGWLELDMLLSAFWNKYGDSLAHDEIERLRDWLLLDDEQLWQLLKNPPTKDKKLAEKIKPRLLDS